MSHLIPPAKPGGRPRGVDMREVINALLYLERSGGTDVCVAGTLPAIEQRLRTHNSIE